MTQKMGSEPRAREEEAKIDLSLTLKVMQSCSQKSSLAEALVSFWSFGHNSKSCG